MITLPPIGLNRRKQVAPTFLSSNFTLLGGSNSTMSITKPAGVASGDILIFFLFHQGNPPNVTSNDGFTVDCDGSFSVQTSNHRIVCHHKIAGGSEPASYSWDFNQGSNTKLGVVLAYRPAHATQLDGAAGGPLQLSSNFSTHQQPSRTTGFTNSTLVYAWMFNRQGGGVLGVISAPPAGMTQRLFENFSTVGASDLGMAIYDQQIPTAGAVGTRTLTTSNGDIDSFGITTAIRAIGT